jgi:hypothetical protein
LSAKFLPSAAEVAFADVTRCFWASDPDGLTVLCCAVLCCAVLCCAVLCCAVLCCAVLCCAVLCCARNTCSRKDNMLGCADAVASLRIGLRTKAWANSAVVH